MTASKQNAAREKATVLLGTSTHVTLTGVLDLNATRDLAPRLFELARAGGRLDVDLSGVPAVERAGLALLVGCRRLSGSSGGRLRLLGARPQVLRALHRTGLDQLAHPRDTESESEPRPRTAPPTRTPGDGEPLHLGEVAAGWTP